MFSIEQVADGIYRISHVIPGQPITFNQFLIEDERPALIHTGWHSMYADVRSAIRRVLDPARLEFIVVAHFEADECGGMRSFAEGGHAAVVCSAVGSVVNLSHWGHRGPVQGVRDGDVLHLGRHRLRFLETPHVHHWDSLMVFEETTGSLFPADLFLQPGDQPAAVTEDLGAEMCEFYRESGIFAAPEPVLRSLRRIRALDPEWVHPMHGGSLGRIVLPRYVDALLTRPFAFDGRVIGRWLPDP